MSEMKPMGYLVTEHETGRVVFTEQSPSPEDMQEYELTCTPIYTAGQLADAAAAERERILRTHNISTEDDLFWYFDDREYGHNDASELLQANEFEIVHIATGRNTGELFGFSSKHEDHFFKTEAEAVAAIEAIRSAAK